MLKKAWRQIIGAAGLSREGVRRCASLLSDRPRLAYVGWVGHHNLGDEAMFRAIQGLLRPCRLMPYRSSDKETVFRHLGLSGRRFFHMVVVGGGTLINPGFWPVVEVLAGQGTPIAMFGTGAGSAGFGQPREVPTDMWSAVAKKFVAVGVRGPLSLRTVKALGFYDAEVIGDPALSLAVEVLPARMRPPRLIVNVAGEPQTELLAALARLLAEFVARGGELLGIALNSRDIHAFARLLGVEGVPHFRVVTVTRDPTMYIRLVSGATAVVAVRLHAAVLACCAGTPPLLFSYRPKCEDFMAAMELTDQLISWDRVDSGLLRDLWLHVESGGEKLRRSILDRAHQWRSAQLRFATGLLQHLRAGLQSAAPLSV